MHQGTGHREVITNGRGNPPIKQTSNMNQTEFTQRTGYTPATEEEWKAIEMMYLEAGETVDKDLFCEEWLKFKDSNLLRIFYKRATNNNDVIEYYRNLCFETAKLFIAKADDYDDNEMYWQAVKLIGQKRVVLYKAENKFDLSEEDRAYIKENLQ